MKIIKIIEKYSEDDHVTIEDHAATLYKSNFSDLTREVDKVIESRDLSLIGDSISQMRENRPRWLSRRFDRLESTCSDDFLAMYKEKKKAYMDLYDEQTKRLSDTYFSLAIY